MYKSWNDYLTETIISPAITYRPSEYTEVLLSNLVFIVSILSIIPIIVIIWEFYNPGNNDIYSIGAYIFAIIISIIWLLYGFLILRNFIVVFGAIILILAKAFLIFLLYRRIKNKE